MNRFVLLFLLIVILPTQLLISYIIHSTDTGMTFQEITVTSMRESTSALYVRTSALISYYSTYKHLKELFFIPYVPKKKKHRDHIQSNSPQTPHAHPTPHGKGTSAAIKQPSLNENHPRDSVSRESNHVSFAKEVESYNEKNVYFARSQSVRLRSIATVRYNIGDVVRHTIDGYHGVIIGWDRDCQAPQKWIADHGYYSQASKSLLRDPHYLVLANSDKQSSYFYIPQSHLIRERTAKVRSPKLSKYFAKYSKSKNKYYAKNWLVKIYPED